MIRRSYLLKSLSTMRSTTCFSDGLSAQIDLSPGKRVEVSKELFLESLLVISDACVIQSSSHNLSFACVFKESSEASLEQQQFAGRFPREISWRSKKGTCWLKEKSSQHLWSYLGLFFLTQKTPVSFYTKAHSPIRHLHGLTN